MSKRKKETKEPTKEGSELEKLATLDAKIAEAEAEGDEVYLKYLLRIRKMTINVQDGGTVIFQSGKPTVPPY